MEVSPFKLVKLGYRLIPVKEGEKIPLIREWSNPNVASSDPHQITDWKDRNPRCNWGIVCWDCLVIDVDIDKKTGESGQPVWEKLCKEWNIPKAPCVITGSGGRHYFFHKTQFEFKNRAKTVVGGKVVPIDIRVGGGGFVVAVGSKHPNGNYYHYEDPNNPLPRIDKLPVIPDEFLKKYFVEKDEKPSSSLKPLDIEYSTEPSSEFVKSCCWQYIDKMAPSIMGEGGSNAIFNVCGKIFWGFALNETDGWDLLNRWNQAHAEPIWSQRELEHKVSDSFKYADRLTYAKGSLRPTPKSVKEASAPISKEAFDKWIKQLKGIDPDCPDVDEDILSQVPNGTVVEGYSEHWFWKNIIYRGLFLLCGDGGTGKSTLMTDWITRVSAGYDWDDGSPCPEGSVIVYTPEDPFARLKVSTRHLKAKTKNIYCIGDCNEDFIQFAINKLYALERLVQQINNNPNIPNVRMICLDPITASIGDLNENSQSEIRPALKMFTQFLNQYNLFGCALIHPRKQGLMDKITSIKDRIAGSSAWTNVPRQVNILQRDPTDPDLRICLPVKHNLSVQPKGFSYRTQEAEPLYYAMDDHSPDAEPCYVRRIIYEQMNIDKMADEFNGQGIYAPSKQHKEQEKMACLDWLPNFLKDGPKPSGTPDTNDTIFGEGMKRHQFSRRMIDQCLKELGCVHYRKDGKTFWELPKEESTSNDYGLGQFSSDEF